MMDISPERLALVAGSDAGEVRRFTFGDIEESTAKVANALRDLGVKRGDRIFIALPNIPESQVILLACFEVGAVPVPASTQLAVDDITARLRTARCVMAMTDHDHADVLDVAANRYGMLDLRVLVGPEEHPGWISLDEWTSGADPHVEPIALAPDEPSLVVFGTSMTVLSRGSLEARRQAWPAFSSEDLHWTVTELGWPEAPCGALFTHLRAGAATFLWDGVDPAGSDRLLPLVAEHRVTSLCASPIVYRHLLRQRLGAYDLSSLRHTTVLASPVSVDLVEAWWRATGLELVRS